MAQTKKSGTSGTKKPAAKKGSGKPDSKKTATKKPSPKGKSKEPEKIPFSERNYSAIMISYLLGGLFIAFFCFVKGSNLWTVLRSAGFAFFGVGFYLLAVQCFAVGITMALKKLSHSLLVTNIFGFIFNLTVGSFVHLCTNKVAQETEGLWLSQLRAAMETSWNIGQGHPSFSGGILGGFFGGGLLHLLGKFGGFAVVVIMLAVSVFLFLNISTDALGERLSSGAIKGKEKLDGSADERRERREHHRQERAARAEEERQRRAEAQEAERKRQAQQEEASRRAAQAHSFDFADTDIETAPSPKNIDRETGMPLRPVRRYFPGKDIFSFEGGDDEGPATDDFDFISEGEGSARPVRPKPMNPFGEEYAEEAPAPEAEKPAADTDVETAEKAAEKAKTQAKKRASAATQAPTPEKTDKPYALPPLDCLNLPTDKSGEGDAAEMQFTAKKLISILESFGVETSLAGISRGPCVTRYELTPGPGVKIARITTLSDDIALGLAASGVRILAPIPDMAAVGVEVPNKSKSMVTLREIITSPAYRKEIDKGKLLTVALGVDVSGGVNFTDLTKMPHLLIAGTTGSGKSVCLNCMIASILFNARPDQVKMIMIDPKQVEFSVYNGIPHLLVPVISDARKAAGSLAWAVSEMDSRYKTFSTMGVRDIGSYNKHIADSPEMEYMPHILVFIDELNDLMMVSPKEVEDSICRLAQKARAAGIHLVVATQRPSVDVITGTIKSNIPARLSLSVSSAVDSKIILDASGAEKLLGNGDMLFSPNGGGKPLRLQGAYLSEDEIERIVDFLKAQSAAEYSSEIMDEIEKKSLSETPSKKGSVDEDKSAKTDPMLDEAIDLITTLNYASTTILQRKLSVGFSRAGRIMDQLETLGYVSPADGNKPRDVLISRAAYLEMKAAASGDASDEGEEAGAEASGADDYDIFSD